MRIALPCLFAVVVAVPATAAAQTAKQGNAYLDGLYDDVAADLERGDPLVVQVHVPLCSNEIIWCGNERLGDGDDPGRNLYWATSGGFLGWMNRRSSGWKQVHAAKGEGDVLAVRVWRRRIAATRTWRARGVTEAFDAYVVAFAWRGSAIRDAMDAYVGDLYGDAVREVDLGGGRVLRAGGAAHAVAYVGHNGWMDTSDYRFPEAGSSSRKKGTIAIACITEDYLAEVSAPERVPLVMTTSLMFAGAHSFEGAARAFAEGRTLARIREAAARNHAAGQDRPVARVRGAFTNPSSRRWKRR